MWMRHSSSSSEKDVGMDSEDTVFTVAGVVDLSYMSGYSNPASDRRSAVVVVGVQ